MDLQRHLAATRAEDRALDADQVAGVEVGEQIEVALTENLATGEQLDSTGAVLEVCERGAAHEALHHQPARKRDLLRPLVVAEERPRLRRRMRRLEAARVGFDPSRAQSL